MKYHLQHQYLPILHIKVKLWNPSLWFQSNPKKGSIPKERFSYIRPWFRDIWSWLGPIWYRPCILWCQKIIICLVKPWFFQDQHLGSNPFLFSLATTCSGHRSNLKGSVWPSDLRQWGKVTKHHYVIKICYPPTSLSFCRVLVEYHLFLDCHPEPPHNQCIHVNQEWQYQEGRSSWRCQSLGFRKGTHGEVAEPWSGEGLGFGLVFRQSFRYILIPILDDARYDHTGIPFHMHPTKLKSRQIIFLPKTIFITIRWGSPWAALWTGHRRGDHPDFDQRSWCCCCPGGSD